MEKNKRGNFLIKNTALFAIGNFATKFISFFLVPLYTNVFTTTEYGTIDLIFTICTILAPILTLNISEAILRFYLDKNDNDNKITSITFAILVTTILTSAIVLPISMLSENINKYRNYFYFYLVTNNFCTVLLILLRAKIMVLKYSIANIIHTIFIAILNILFLLVLKMNIEGYFLAYIFANILTIIYTFKSGDIIKDLKVITMDYDLLKKMLKYSVVLIPTSFLMWIIKASDRIVITNFLGIAENGIYAISYKLPLFLVNVIAIFNQAWLYSAVDEKDSKDNEQYTNKIYNCLFIIVIIITSGLLVILKPFLSIYVSSEYYEAWKYTPFLLVGSAFWAISGFIETTYKVQKDSKGVLFSIGVAAILNVILNFILIPICGINGAAIATCISYVLIFIYRIRDTRKYVKIHITKTQIIATILFVIIAMTVYIDNVIGQVLLIIEFLIMIIVFKNIWYPMAKNIIESLLIKLKNKNKNN